MQRLLALAAALMAASGCATSNQVITVSPVSGASWDGSVISKPYSAPRSWMVGAINSRVKGADDEYAKRFASNVINKEIPASQETVSYAVNSSCESKIDYLLQKMEPIINELPNSVHYVLKYNTATGTKVHPKIENKVSTVKKGDSAYLLQLSSNMVWPLDVGFVKINVLTTARCDGRNNIIFKVSIPDYSIKNPTLWLGGQKIAELSVDWETTKHIMDAIKKEYVSQDGEGKYWDDVKMVADGINSKLANRFKKQPRETSKNEERLYKIAPNIVSSRIQRKLELYKYSKDKTRYEFSDKVVIRGIHVDPKTIIKEFPEEGGKTSVVFSLEYSPIYDNIAGKTVFGEEDANRYLLGQIDIFEKMIATP